MAAKDHTDYQRQGSNLIDPTFRSHTAARSSHVESNDAAEFRCKRNKEKKEEEKRKRK
jgi:hypothetical protein